MKTKLFLCFTLVLSHICQATIIYPDAPDGGRQIVMEHLDLTTLEFLEVSHFEDLTIGNPVGVYSYSAALTNLLAGQLLSKVKLYAWRYPLMRDTNAVGLMDLNADETRGKLLKFVSLTKTASDNPALAALKIAEKLPSVKSQDFEMRYLDMAPLLFRAVWLHGTLDDIIIPLPPTFGRWTAFQPYSESEIVQLLKPEVTKKLKAPLSRFQTNLNSQNL